MAANISQGKRWGIVTACRMAQLPGWTLRVSCRTCERTVEVPLAGLNPDRTLPDVLAKLRCQKCRAEPSAVEGGVDKGERIKLLGPGAYG